MKSIKKLIVMCAAGCLGLLTAACGGGVADAEPQVPTVNVGNKPISVENKWLNNSHLNLCLSWTEIT